MPSDIAQFFGKFKQRYEARREERVSFEEYLGRCKADPNTYDSAHGRLLRAIGKPIIFETQKDERLGRIFQNQTIRLYPTFSRFYGIEHAIEELVTFIERASRGGEGEKQICYMLGPVGSGKSSLVERLKELFQSEPFYALVDEDGKTSPIFESPLGIFCDPADRAMLEAEYKIDSRFVPSVRSRWVQKRLTKYGGDFRKFSVVKLYPSIVEQIGIAETAPADENTQDVSTLVGKTDIRVLDELAQSDPDSYVYSGALCASVQGVLDYVEMFKSQIKMLHPLIPATQEHRFEPSERIGALPYNGIIVAHSNESEWTAFKSKQENEALLSRITLIRVPYCLRVNEEIDIYKKKIGGSAYKNAPCAPGTFEVMAKFAVLSRLTPFEGSALPVKMRAYNGENLRDKDIEAKPIHEYRERAGVEEGMKGIDTRFAYKAIERAFEFDPREMSANPVTLLRVLEEEIRKEKLPKTMEEKYLEFLKDPVEKELIKFIGNELRDAYFSTLGGEFAQNLFERYFWLADHWIDNKDYHDPKTGTLMKRKEIDAELQKIEKPANISNPKDFRNEVVRWIWKNMDAEKRVPDRKSFPKLNEAVELAAFPSFEEFLPVFARKSKGTADQVQKYNAFLTAMKNKGYTPSMAELLGEWWQRKHAGG